MHEHHLLGLLHLTDATLPIGAYAHSMGLETYVQKGIVKDAASSEAFIRGMLTQSIQYTDAAIVSLAFDAAENANMQKILQLDMLCNAVKLPMETRLASSKLGMRLLKVFDDLLPGSMVGRYKQCILEQEADGHYAVAFGVCAFALQITKRSALTGFYYNTAVSMVTNSVKLIPLGQQQGQQLLSALYRLIMQLVDNSICPDESLIGLCSPGSDIRCMQHEQLYSRLYMS